jgi:putative transposase
VIFAFIDQHKDFWPVTVLCHTRGVSPQGFYSWRLRPPSAQEQRRVALVVKIRSVHAEVKARYGSPRIYAELKANGIDCCVNTVAKLMHDNDIRAKTTRKFRNTTDSNLPLPVADNLLDRQFDPDGPNERWVTEIVYSQMTKPARLAGRPDREHITDLDVVPGYYDPVDEQLDQLSFPLKR